MGTVIDGVHNTKTYVVYFKYKLYDHHNKLYQGLLNHQFFGIRRNMLLENN